jgi:tRNA (cytidine/uridine-2'-O-)-methyltransferase
MLNIVLVEPEIAANAGAIGRTCVAAGARLWLVRPLGFHLDDRHLRRAGLDYWSDLSVRVVNHIGEVVNALEASQIWSFSTKAARPYTDATFAADDALVFGSEGHGLPASWLAAQGKRALRIPMEPLTRSLNLSSAVAIALFEARRQVGLRRPET